MFKAISQIQVTNIYTIDPKHSNNQGVLNYIPTAISLYGIYDTTLTNTPIYSSFFGKPSGQTLPCFERYQLFLKHHKCSDNNWTFWPAPRPFFVIMSQCNVEPRDKRICTAAQSGPFQISENARSESSSGCRSRSWFLRKKIQHNRTSSPWREAMQRSLT